MTKISIVALAGLMALVSARADALTYTGSLTAGATTATYSIDTDGTFGVINSGNVLNVTATITSATETTSFTNPNFLVFAGTTTTASATQIVFDPTQSGYIVAGQSAAAFPVICLTGNNISCIGEGARSIFLAANLSGGDYEYRFATAPYVVATAASVPEPATWGLMLAGFALTGVAVRRRTTVAA